MRTKFTSKPGSSRNLLPCKFSYKHSAMKSRAKRTTPQLYSLQSTRSGQLLKVNGAHFRHQERDEAWRSAAAASLSIAQKLGYKIVSWDVSRGISAQEFRYLAEGLLLFDYGFDRYKENGRNADLSVEIAGGESTSAFRSSFNRLKKIFRGVNTARDLANTPANDLPPRKLAALAKKICQRHGMAYKQLSATQLAQQNYVGITAVGSGSANPPVLFSMTYDPGQSRKVPELCLVGKGITFDSGGISIKPWDGMWDMKADMGGAAAVVGAMQAIALLKPKIRVTGVVAAAENMPDGRAYRPGDILEYRNGTSVEIRSTDAEGRLVLADALIYAQQTLKQKRIVDMATLTGACLRALGNQYIGLLSLSRELTASVTKCAEEAGEPVWQLPLHPEYRRFLASPIADIRNGGGPLAGASTAGWFLHEFIDEGTDYVHLDIASTFLAAKVDKYWSQPGATGSGVRLCAALAEKLA